jgi:hypothetical protein
MDRRGRDRGSGVRLHRTGDGRNRIEFAAADANDAARGRAPGQRARHRPAAHGDQGNCIRTNPARGEWQCSWTNKLADGQITVEGPFYDTRDSRLAIIGGTGIYRDAHGTMLLHARPDGYDFVFSID